jgi:hypothetical protein
MCYSSPPKSNATGVRRFSKIGAAVLRIQDVSLNLARPKLWPPEGRAQLCFLAACIFAFTCTCGVAREAPHSLVGADVECSGHLTLVVSIHDHS